MENYTKSPISTPPEITSSVNSIDNVKKLVLHMMTMEGWGNSQEQFSVFKDVNNYNDAKNYVKSIGDMINRSSTFKIPSEGETPKLPQAYIASVPGIINETRFTVDQISDSTSDYMMLIKDMNFYQRVLSMAVMMNYITEIFEGIGQSMHISLKASITADQIANIAAQILTGQWNLITPINDNVSGAVISRTQIKEETD